jgi:hypothetical protein
MAAYWPSSTEPFAAPMNRIPKVSSRGTDPPELRGRNRRPGHAAAGAHDLAVGLRRTGHRKLDCRAGRHKALIRPGGC